MIPTTSEAEPIRYRAADSHTASDLSSPAGCAVRDGIAAAREMEKMTGIGGFFFRAHQLHPGLLTFPPRHLVLCRLEMLIILTSRPRIFANQFLLSALSPYQMLPFYQIYVDNIQRRQYIAII